MQDSPGLHTLEVTIHDSKQTTQLNYSITINKENYRVQHLKLPKNKVDLDSKTFETGPTRTKRNVGSLSPHQLRTVME